MTYSEAKRLFKRVFGILVLVAAGIYGGDYLWLRLRVESKNPNAAFGSVTVFYSTTLKNGKVEFFYDQPQTQTCVHSMFPHLGYTPCWYLQRAGHDVKQISLLAMPPNLSGRETSDLGTGNETQAAFREGAILIARRGRN